MLFDAIATFLIGGSVIVSAVIAFLVNDSKCGLKA